MLRLSMSIRRHWTSSFMWWQIPQSFREGAFRNPWSDLLSLLLDLLKCHFALLRSTYGCIYSTLAHWDIRFINQSGKVKPLFLLLGGSCHFFNFVCDVCIRGSWTCPGCVAFRSHRYFAHWSVVNGRHSSETYCWHLFWGQLNAHDTLDNWHVFEAFSDDAANYILNRNLLLKMGNQRFDNHFEPMLTNH